MTRRYGCCLSPYFNDRRCGKERRKFSYAIHLPERRTGNDRRSGKDRRSELERLKTPRRIINRMARA
jgi:hypothetical protein